MIKRNKNTAKLMIEKQNLRFKVHIWEKKKLDKSNKVKKLTLKF